MIPTRQDPIRVLRHLGMGVLAALTFGCAIRLISEYDDTTDREVMQLQRSVDFFLRGLARNPRPPGCTYAARSGFYDSTASALGSLTIRNRARDKNEITVQQLLLLDSSLSVLERLHRARGDTVCLTPEAIQPVRENFNTSFAAILKLELGKKRK